MARQKRKSIGKKQRFEIFKRDKFTCQYCGRKSPDVVLVCDHVSPVVAGGKNTLLNLITSCVDCNAGKGATQLDDDTALLKQRAELERLAERREQIDMMLQWSRGMEESASQEADALASRWRELLDCQFYVNERGLADARKWLRSFGLADLLESASVAAAQYLNRDADGKIAQESAQLGWSKIPGITRLSKLPPDEKALYYVRGILRKRLSYINEYESMSLIRSAHAAGVCADELKEIAKTTRNWTEWRNEMNDLIPL